MHLHCTRPHHIAVFALAPIQIVFIDAARARRTIGQVEIEAFVDTYRRAAFAARIVWLLVDVILAALYKGT